MQIRQIHSEYASHYIRTHIIVLGQSLHDLCYFNRVYLHVLVDTGMYRFRKNLK